MIQFLKRWFYITIIYVIAWTYNPVHFLRYDYTYGPSHHIREPLCNLVHEDVVSRGDVLGGGERNSPSCLCSARSQKGLNI